MPRQLAWKLSDKFKRKLFLKKIFIFWLNKFFKKNYLTSLFLKFQQLFLMQALYKNFYSLKPYNLCLLSGRSHNVLRLPKCSRFVLRFQSYKALLPGISRAS